MDIVVMGSTARINVKQNNLNKVLDFCKKYNLPRSIIIVKKGLTKTYCVKIFKCSKHIVDLFELLI